MQIRRTGEPDAGAITARLVAVWREIHPDLVPAEVLAGLSVEGRAADSERGYARDNLMDDAGPGRSGPGASPPLTAAGRYSRSQRFGLGFAITARLLP